MRLSFQTGDNQIVLDVTPEGETWRVRLPDGTEHRITASRLPGDMLQVTEVGPDADSPVRAFRAAFAHTEQGIELSFEGVAYLFAPGASRQSSGGRKSASGKLTAPMVGTVIDVLVREGETVEAYQPLVRIEAMKVMATVAAPFAGTVKAVYVQKEQRVAHDAPIIDIAPEVPTPSPSSTL
jgi:biotin carboxyl carrier protein